MSQARVHNFSISLDGFGTGDGITFDAPFGHAGERLHEWMFTTRYWHSMVGEPGGTSGVDHAFADRHGPVERGEAVSAGWGPGGPVGHWPPPASPPVDGDVVGRSPPRAARDCGPSPGTRHTLPGPGGLRSP